jgi:hypothetical protein
MLVTGIAGCLVAHGMFWWHYFNMAEWWRQTIPW